MSGMNSRQAKSGKTRSQQRGARSVLDLDPVSVDPRSSPQPSDDGEGPSSPVDPLEDLVEQLGEKRSSTRQAALTKFIHELQLNYLFDFVNDRMDTLQMYVMNSIRKGDAKEVALACQALSLMALTLGADSEALAKGVSPTLYELLKFGKSTGSRSSIAEATGFVQFMGSLADEDTLEAMAHLQACLKSPQTLAEEVAVACWNAWGLLASTLPAPILTSQVRESILPAMMEFLEHESTEVKTAVGCCIALLWEAKQEIEAAKEEAGEEEEEEEEEEEGAAGEQKQADEDDIGDLPEMSLPESAVPTAASSSSPAEDEDEDEDEMSALGVGGEASEGKRSDSFGPISGMTQSPAFLARKRPLTKQQKQASSRAKAAVSAGVIDDDTVLAKLQELANESSRYVGKKEKKEQKRTFRDVLSTVEDGELPEESLKIEKSRHTFVGWRELKQLSALREVVGKGVNVHFVHNETVAEIFGLMIEEGEGVDDPARKAESRAQSKAKEMENFQHRQKQRSKKMAFNVAGGAGDE